MKWWKCETAFVRAVLRTQHSLLLQFHNERSSNLTRYYLYTCTVARPGSEIEVTVNTDCGRRQALLSSSIKISLVVCRTGIATSDVRTSILRTRSTGRDTYFFSGRCQSRSHVVAQRYGTSMQSCAWFVREKDGRITQTDFVPSYHFKI
jgi:hypothetical protein